MRSHWEDKRKDEHYDGRTNRSRSTDSGSDSQRQYQGQYERDHHRSDLPWTPDRPFYNSSSRTTSTFMSRSSSNLEPYRIPSRSGNSFNQHSTSHSHPGKHRKKTSLDIASTFADNTSLQGVIFIKNSNRWWSTAFWTLCFLAAFAMALFQLYYNFDDYFSHPYSTVVKLDFAFLPFPSVTLCNMNPIRISKANRLSPELQEYFEKYKPANRPGINSTGSQQQSTQDGSMQQPTQDGSIQQPTQDGSMQQPPQDSSMQQPSQNSSMQQPPQNGSMQQPPPPQNGSMQQPPPPPQNGSMQQPPQNGTMQQPPPPQDGSMQSPPQQPPLRTKRAAMMPPPSPGPGRFTDERSSTYETVDDFINLYGNLSTDLRKEIGNPGEIFIVECSFNGYACSHENFTGNLSPRYGNCYTFNGKNERLGITESYRSYQSGKLYGLQVTLYIDTIEYPPGGVTEAEGVAVAIQHFNTLSFPEINGLSVFAGSAFSIGMRMNNVTRLGSPYSKCIDKEDPAFVQEYGHYYTKEACLVTCFYQAVAKECGCIRTPYEVYHRPSDLLKYPICNQTGKDCVEALSVSLRNGLIDECDDCQPACQEVSYDLVTSSAKWPDRSLSEYLSSRIISLNPRYREFFDMQSQDNIHGFAQETVQKELLQINIYYRDLNYQNIIERADYTVATFASDIGGTLGLWLGVSALTGAELLAFVTQLFYNCFKNRRQDQQ